MICFGGKLVDYTLIKIRKLIWMMPDPVRYHREQYPKISEMLSGYLTPLPRSAPSTWIAQPHIESLQEKPPSISFNPTQR
jgi:hypothetical protein